MASKRIPLLIAGGLGVAALVAGAAIVPQQAANAATVTVYKSPT